MSPVQGKSPPVQVKEPYGNFDMVQYLHAFILQPRSVQRTPADNTRKRVWQYIEKERKRKRGLLMGRKEANKQKPDLGNLRPKLSDARS